MESFCFVRPEHLNHHGYLFGGQMLKWVDEFSWIAATRDHENTLFVTKALAEILFTSRVVNGSILRFRVDPVSRGRTSVTYQTQVYASAPEYTGEELVFSTTVTFVSVDDEGHAVPPRSRSALT